MTDPRVHSLRKVPPSFSTGRDRTNAHKAWLAGFDTAASYLLSQIADLKAQVKTMDDGLARIAAMNAKISQLFQARTTHVRQTAASQRKLRRS